MSNAIFHSDLSKPIYERLKKMIESGQLLAGQKLVQEKLATELGVSRTPLLKALHKLEHEMLVESIPRRGMYVKKISINEMIHVYECREAVECMAVRLLAARARTEELKLLAGVFNSFEGLKKINRKKYSLADERFHDMIIKFAQNPVLEKMSSVCNIHKRVYQFGLIRPPAETLEEHMAIVKAIMVRDVEKAEAAMGYHISASKAKLIEQLETD